MPPVQEMICCDAGACNTAAIVHLQFGIASRQLEHRFGDISKGHLLFVILLSRLNVAVRKRVVHVCTHTCIAACGRHAHAYAAA